MCIKHDHSHSILEICRKIFFMIAQSRRLLRNCFRVTKIKIVYYNMVVTIIDILWKKQKRWGQ